jgi:hypothetical protein
VTIVCACQVEWRGSGATRHMHIALRLRPSPVAPTRVGVTRCELRWTWEWRGWRRLPGAAPAAHAAERAVGLQAEATIAAAFAEGRHIAAAAYGPAAAPARVVAEAEAEAAENSESNTWPGAIVPEPVAPV